MVSVILGARRLAHSGLLRQDEVIHEIFGWSRGMASQSTFSRFFSKYDFEDNDKIFPALQKWWFEQFELDKYTIDLDSTVLTRYGGGKTLFPDLDEYNKYTYSAFVTNTDLSAPMVWSLYRKRADCENRIKELKQDYGIEGFCLQQMGASEHAFRWIMVAHNLMSLFKLQVLKKKRKTPQLASLNLQCIAIGSYLCRSARKTTLKLAVHHKRRAFIDGLFGNLADSSPPFSVSIA